MASDTELTPSDIAFLIESVTYSKRTFEDYKKYPTEEFRNQRIAEADAVLRKPRALRSRGA